MSEKFESHPTKKEFAKAIGRSVWTVRNLIEAGVLRGVRYTGEVRPHKDDCNRYLEKGMSEEEHSRYSAYVKSRAGKTKEAKDV